MNTLLLDIGNTRIKWALDDGRGFAASDSLATRDASELGHRIDRLAFARASAVCVAGAAVESTIAAALRHPVEWFRSVAECQGVRNAYRDPARLGPDRLLALVAAHRRDAAPCIVAAVGTAVTVDALAAEGRHLGGIILPGLAAMRDALNAATVGVRADAGHVNDFPDNTDDAVATGTLLAVAGAVERLRALLADRAGRSVRVLLTGGDAAVLAPHLAVPVELMEHLVLEGLAIVSRTRP